MKIVIVGAKDRTSESDRADVETLLAKLAERFGTFMAVSVTAYTGIGKLVKETCHRKRADGTFTYSFLEVDTHVYARDVPKTEMIQIYTARNATLYELGDVFISFPHPHARSITDELMENRVIPNKRPHKIFYTGEDICIDDIMLTPGTK